jgi:5-methylcytosine-specific restriction protein A
LKRIDGKTLNELWGVGAKHALYREDGKWYHHLEEFPGALFDRNGFIKFSTKDEYLASPFLQHGQHLHVPYGIAEMPGYIRVLEVIDNNATTFDTNNEVIRLKREVAIRNRNRKLVEQIKRLYQNTCQICGLQMRINHNKYYSEVHHIKPLGEPHYGPDSIDNMLCVCPNHHVLLDLGGIFLDINSIYLISGHSVDIHYIEYHNQKIFGQII